MTNHLVRRMVYIIFGREKYLNTFSVDRFEMCKFFFLLNSQFKCAISIWLFVFVLMCVNI